MTLQEIADLGIVGAGGAGFPTHVKLAAHPEFLRISEQGMRMEHGATTHSDVVVVFITNKKFEIHFTERKET